jgi:hypothetical protein
MSTQEASAYEPFRNNRHAGAATGEDTEKLIQGEPREAGPEYSTRRKEPKQSGTIQRVRISFRVIAFILAVTILGVQAWSAYKWLSTRNQWVYNPKTKLNTRAWAIIDGWPTWVMMAAAVVAMVIQMTALTSHLCVCVS